MRKPLVIFAIGFLLGMFFYKNVFAQTQEKIIWPKDKYGTELKYKGGYVIGKDGSLTAVDSIGNRQPHKQVIICIKQKDGKEVCPK